MKRAVILLILAAMLLQTTACGSEETLNNDTAVTTPSEVTTAAEPYTLPDIDFGEGSFTIMNTANLWGMNTELDFEAQSGEALDDKVYARNRFVEEQFNMKLEIVEIDSGDYYKLQDHIRTDVYSDDSTYDAAYCCGGYVSSLIPEGCLMNLYDVPNLQITEPWWNQITREQATLGDDTVYFTLSNLSLTAFDLTWCLFFNESMMEELSIETPYDLVREGKWTVDELHSYAKKGANLNGDDSFAFSDNGKSVYGFTTYNNGILASMAGAGITLTTKDENGMPVFNPENDRFYDAVEKLAALCGSEGDFFRSVTGQNADRYTNVFRNRRALFVGAEVKEALAYRDLDDTFGVIPNPKLDASQESYVSCVSYLAPVLVVPITTSSPERTGVVLDALSYYSYRDVLPVYYDLTLSQKGLRNEDSIEMMDIIRDSFYLDAGIAYGWTLKLAESIRQSLYEGNASVASTIASNRQSIEQSIQNMLEELE